MSKEDLIYQIAASFAEKNPRYTVEHKSQPIEAGNYQRRRDGRDRDRGGRDRRRGNADFTRLFINLGTMDLPQKGDFLGYICRSCNISGDFVGRIDMSEKYSFFDIHKSRADQVIDALDGGDYKGRDLRVNQDRPSNDRRNHRRGQRGGARRR